nr:MAG TPA: hypothetical protein [Caudoviricetes sp.]
MPEQLKRSSELIAAEIRAELGFDKIILTELRWKYARTTKTKFGADCSGNPC